MYHLHVTRNLRSLAFLLVASVVMAALGTLWWANHTGLPESWRATIEREVSKQGAHIKIGALSYLPLRGVAASDIRVFSDAAHEHEISRLERVLLDFDKTKLARGKVHITRIELKNAGLILPVDPNDPESESLEVTDASGTLYMPGGRRFEVRNASGRIAGIKVSLNARLIGYQQEGENPNNASQRGKRRELLAKAIGELNKWHFDRDHPPEIRVFLEGDANENSSLTAKVTLLAKGVEKNQHELDEISAEAEITGDLLTVTSLHATDSRGKLEGHVDYDIGDREGRFDLHSTLEIPPLLKAWAGLPPLRDVVIGGGQTLEAEGGFRLDEKNVPQVHMTGSARLESVMLRGVRFDAVQSVFAWRDGDLFLRDVHLIRDDGTVTGKAMIQWPLVRLALESTVPEQVFKPFFIGQPLEKVIGDFSDRKGAEVHVTLEGGFDATDRTSWAYTGTGRVKNVNYKGVPVNSAECKMSLSHHELDFFDGTVVFNYQTYPLREAFNGPREATTKVGRIRYDAPSKTVEVENVTGTFWAAPLVRLFAPKVADSLEVYRFHTPPNLKGAGVVDVTPQGRTALDVSFNSEGAANYTFLGEDLTLTRPSGKVLIRGERVTVDDLKLNGFDGPVTARFDFRGKGRMEGEMTWTRLSIPELTSTYGFQIKGGGKVTGRLDFSLTDGRVETMNGEGLFALEKTELFSVPMFGPLSPLVSGVVNDRRAGFERAKNAFCNFKIKDGILSTRDFQTSTTSLTFAGDGSVDLKERTLDMTMRMNARGLLGLITLPLRPFYGMFQFRGTGPLKDTKWENVMFTAPPEEQTELLSPAPKAKLVRERE
jgi:hypothetical protein